MGDVTPDMLMRAYGMGVFPMSESKDDPEIFWVDPRHRGILPLDRFHRSKSLIKRMRKTPHHVTLNKAFLPVVEACADRDDTWISDTIFQLYSDLHDRGEAHSLEVWCDDQLIGGVYGVALGSAFFGESMFSRATDGSKIALAYLTTHLRTCGFTLFDTQFISDHLISLGAVEIPRRLYHSYLKQAVLQKADIASVQLPELSDVLCASQRKTQTS